MAGFDKLTHIPYLTVIGILILALLGLSLYMYISSRRKTKNMAVQTYFTCLPKKPTSAQLESLGLAKMSLTKGKRVEYGDQTRYTGDPTSNGQSNNMHPADTAYNMPDDTDNTMTSQTMYSHDDVTKSVPKRRQAPAIPEDAASKPALPPKKNRNYENADAWMSTTENNYRVSQLVAIDTSRAYTDDDLISADFLDDSFETYEDEYINTQQLGEINQGHQ